MAQPVNQKAMLGHKIRRFRQELHLSQTEMAEQLDVSASYLNLIEHNQRPVTVPLLFRLGQAFDIDLKEFAVDDSARLATSLREVFSDTIFVRNSVPDTDVRALADVSPASAEAVLHLYEQFRAVKNDVQAMAERISDRSGGEGAFEGDILDHVRVFYEQNNNYFSTLEELSDQFWQEQHYAADRLPEIFTGYMEHALGISVKVMPAEVMGGVLRRYDFHRRRLLLSEALTTTQRLFQTAVQLGLLAWRPALDRLLTQADLAGDDVEAMARVGLANYLAAALIMPYDRFIDAARAFRYDIELLCTRFGASFEQVCHRLTTLNRRGQKGIPFFFMRTDVAGNVSKRLSAGGFQFARFGGTCPKWIVYEAFRAPERVHVQVAEMADRTRFLTIARTVDAGPRGYHARRSHKAIAVGCDIRYAQQLVYADGLDLHHPDVATEVGVNCRICERLDCRERAYPLLSHRTRQDVNILSASPFSDLPAT